MSSRALAERLEGRLSPEAATWFRGALDAVADDDRFRGAWSAAGRRLGIPSVVTCDSGEFTAILEIDYGLQIRWRQRCAVAAALKLATQVTVCSAYMERLAVAEGRLTESRG